MSLKYIIMLKIKFNSEPYLKIAKQYMLSQKLLQNKQNTLDEIINIHKSQIFYLKELKTLGNV